MTYPCGTWQPDRLTVGVVLFREARGGLKRYSKWPHLLLSGLSGHLYEWVSMTPTSPLSAAFIPILNSEFSQQQVTGNIPTGAYPGVCPCFSAVVANHEETKKMTKLIQEIRRPISVLLCLEVDGWMHPAHLITWHEEDKNLGLQLCHVFGWY